MLPVFNCCWQFQPRLFAKPSSPIQQAPYLTLQRQAPKGKQAAQGHRGLAMPACSAGNISVYANSNILNISVNAEYRKKTKNPEIIMSTTLPGSWLMEELPLPPTAQESQGRAPASPKQLDLPLLSSNLSPGIRCTSCTPFSHYITFLQFPVDRNKTSLGIFSYCLLREKTHQLFLEPERRTNLDD